MGRGVREGFGMTEVFLILVLGVITQMSVTHKTAFLLYINYISVKLILINNGEVKGDKQL